MATLRVVATYEITIILAFLFVIVVGKLLNGEIVTDDLLHVKLPGSEHQMSPARVQLLVMTLAGAWEYLTLVFTDYPSHKMPEMPNSLMAVFAGSHAVYLGSKALPVLITKLRGVIR